MRKLGLGLLLCFTIFFGGCTSAEFSENLQTVVGKLGEFRETLAKTTGSEYTNGKHYYYIKLPETSYNYATELELQIMYRYEGSEVHYWIEGGVPAKPGKNLSLQFTAPIFDERGDLYKKEKRTEHNPANFSMGDYYVARNRGGRLYMPQDQVFVGVYYKGKLVNSNHPEWFTKTKTTAKKSYKKPVKKTYQKAAPKKAVKQQRQTRQSRSTATKKSTSPQQRQPRQQRQQRRQSL